MPAGTDEPTDAIECLEGRSLEQQHEAAVGEVEGARPRGPVERMDVAHHELDSPQPDLVQHASSNRQRIVALIDAHDQAGLTDGLRQHLEGAQWTTSDIDRASPRGEADLPAGEPNLFDLSLRITEQPRHFAVVRIKDILGLLHGRTVPSAGRAARLDGATMRDVAVSGALRVQPGVRT